MKFDCDSFLHRLNERAAYHWITFRIILKKYLLSIFFFESFANKVFFLRKKSRQSKEVRRMQCECPFEPGLNTLDFCVWYLEMQSLETWPGPYLGFECNFRFLQMPYFGRQVTNWAWSTQPTLVWELLLQLGSRRSQNAVEHLCLLFFNKFLLFTNW